jgi:hypothetical protein
MILWTACGASAQQSVTSATLSGIVSDPNGAVVPGATVIATNLDTNRRSLSETNSEGLFRFQSLAVGPYRLTATGPGFGTYSRDLTLEVGQQIELPINLAIKEVDGEVSSIEWEEPVSTGTVLANVVSPKMITSLPLNGRNYLDLALLSPGVSRTNTGSVQRFAETSAVPGTGISVAGQRNLNNSFIVDGMSANDDAADLTGTFYSQEVVREFQTITSGGSAEYSRASSGAISIITQGGSNYFRGRAYGFLRNQRFDARNPLAPSRDPLTQGQYGVTLGGPIHKNRTFFFTNFEQTRRNDSNVITVSPVNVNIVNNRLNATGYPGPRLETGLVPGGYDISDLFLRVDQVVTDLESFSVTYNYYDISAVNARTVGGLNTLSRGTALADRDHTLNLGWQSVLSPYWMNQARFQFRHSALDAPPNDLVGPAVNISGIASFGTATSSPTGRDNDLFEFSDTAAVTVGNHNIKFGGDLLYNRVNILFPGALQGVYAFSSLSNFLTGNYTNYQQAFGAPGQFQSNPNVGLFIQDDWRVRADLVFNVGLRYDVQQLPSPIETDRNNFAPRFSVSYAPGDQRTVIRAGFGLYYNRIPLRATSNALQRDGSKYIVAQFTPTQPGAPVFPHVLATQPSNTILKPNVTRIDPAIEPDYAIQANLQIERELFRGWMVSAGYVHLRGLHLILSRNVNVPQCTAAVNPNLCRPDPNFGNISRYESSGVSNFDGLLTSFKGRFGEWGSMQASYTLSKTLDNAGNFFFFTPQNNFDLGAEKGLSDNDQRHRLVINGTFTVKDAPVVASFFRKAVGGIQFGLIFSYASALPFNIQTGNDRNGDSNNNDRPVGVGRNTGKGFDFASLDLRVSRVFRFNERFSLEALAEGFNLFNRSNLMIPNNIYGTGALPLPAFGRATAAGDPRQIQFGLKFNF